MRPESFRRSTSRGFYRLLVGLAVVIVLVDLSVAAVQAERFARIGWHVHQRPKQLPRDDDLDPLAYFAPTAALSAAQQLIPRRATYTVVVGNSPPVPDPALIRIVFEMWLVPRLYTERRADAQWVVAYHHPSETIGVPYVSETGIAPGVNLLKVRR